MAATLRVTCSAGAGPNDEAEVVDVEPNVHIRVDEAAARGRGRRPEEAGHPGPGGHGPTQIRPGCGRRARGREGGRRW
jgi:hypothetical protein